MFYKKNPKAVILKHPKGGLILDVSTALGFCSPYEFKHPLVGQNDDKDNALITLPLVLTHEAKRSATAVTQRGSTTNRETL